MLIRGVRAACICFQVVDWVDYNVSALHTAVTCAACTGLFPTCRKSAHPSQGRISRTHLPATNPSERMYLMQHTPPAAAVSQAAPLRHKSVRCSCTHVAAHHTGHPAACCRPSWLCSTATRHADMPRLDAQTFGLDLHSRVAACVYHRPVVAPTQDVLGHPATLLLVSHCGLHSVYEAAFHGVPVVGAPFMFEQVDTACFIGTSGS